MPKTLGGSLFVRNAIKFDYCVIEALESIYELCDEVSVLECGSDDGTAELLIKWAASKQGGKRVILETGHPWVVGTNYDRLAILANEARKKLSTDWHFMIQADEIVHESCFGLVRDLIERPFNAYYFRRFNLFLGPDNCIRLDSNKKPCGDVVCRLARTNIPVVGDAESISDAGVDGSYVNRLPIFHYGYVREGASQIAKAIDMQSWFFGPGSTPDQRIIDMRGNGNQFRPQVYFSKEDVIPVPMPHPKFANILVERLRNEYRIQEALFLADQVEGWMSTQELNWLAGQATKHLAIIELGSWMGRSTKAIGFATYGLVAAVDHWLGNVAEKNIAYEQAQKIGQANLIEIFRKNLRPEISAGKVIPVIGDNTSVAPIVKRLFEDRKLVPDMLFIDSDHTYESVKQDIETYAPMIPAGGLICGHDWGADSLMRAVRETLGEPEKIVGSIWIHKAKGAR